MKTNEIIQKHEVADSSTAIMKSTDEEIRNLLSELGFSSGSKGYKYLVHIIKLGMNNINDIMPLATNGYLKVAKRFKKTDTGVEKAIRRTIENAFLDGDSHTWKRIFKNSYSVSKGRPTNAKFIITLVEYLCFVKNHEEQKTTEAIKVISDEYVREFLKTLGVSVERKGYVYLTEIIKLGLDDINNIMPITKNGYPRIAKIFKTKATNVDRAIRYTIENAFLDGDLETWKRIFKNPYSVSKEKPTNTKFIITLVEYLSYVKNHEEQKTAEATKVISDEYVKRLLKTLGVSVEGKGYVYLTEIIKLGLDDMNNIMPITKNGYPRIAKIFKTKATNVDRAIRYTIEKAAINGNTDTWEYIFTPKRKPTNTYFVITLVKYLKSLIKEPKLTTESIKKASP